MIIYTVNALYTYFNIQSETGIYLHSNLSATEEVPIIANIKRDL